MRRLLFSAAVIVGVGWVGLAPAMATSLGLPGLNGSNINATEVEKVGYWRRLYRRYGYPAPYAYYPPAYSYYPPPTHTHTLQLCMATSRLRLRTPTLGPCMAIRHLRRPRMATIPPQKATTATIHPQRAATTVTSS